MSQTFINLPESISHCISLLLQKSNKTWLKDAQALHSRYMNRMTDDISYLQSIDDSLSYLALRVPATYSQLSSALSQLKEMLPSFNPQSVLDLGSGPGVGVWAAHELWPSLSKAICVEINSDMITFGKRIHKEVSLSLPITWKEADITPDIINKYADVDLIIIGNVLNELSFQKRESLLESLSQATRPVILLLEPGNERGIEIINETTKQLYKTKTLIAPFINNTFVTHKSYWLHFSQRFIRPPFERQLRQSMREKSEMASDWEETKYVYVAVGSRITPKMIWGRCIGKVIKYKGYIEVPVITSENISIVKVLKRHKKAYAFAKDLRWGDIITNKEDLIHNTDL